MPDNGLFSLTGQVAVVIGGGGVLAGAMAVGLAKAGADIAILDVSQEAAQKQAKSITTLGRQAIGVQCDATSKPALQHALESILESLGHVDILINAAGVNSGTPFFEITEEEYDRIMNIDLKSVFLACQVFGKQMVDAQRGGSLINISSASSPSFPASSPPSKTASCSPTTASPASWATPPCTVSAKAAN